MVRGLIDYFSLSGPRAELGEGESSNIDQVILFVGVALGASAKVVYDAITASGPLNVPTFAIALIASLVIFPQFHYSGGLNKKRISFAHWALAFQNGFFWSIALDQVASRMGGN